MRGVSSSSSSPSSSEFTKSYTAIADALVVWVKLHLFPKLRSRVEAEDIIQEVWCRAYQRFGTFEPERGSFRGWVLGIAEKVLLEELRRLGRSGPGSNTELPSVQHLVAEITSISERAARNERGNHLGQGLPNPYSDGGATQFFRLFSAIGPDVNIFAKRPGNLPVIIGGKSQ